MTWGDKWRELEGTALKIGLNLEYFWRLNPKQFNKHIKAWTENEEDRMREKDIQNWILGKYITYAFNDPKHYPKKAFLDNMIVESEMTDEEMEKQAIRNTIKMGGVIKNDT